MDEITTYSVHELHNAVTPDEKPASADAQTARTDCCQPVNGAQTSERFQPVGCSPAETPRLSFDVPQKIYRCTPYNFKITDRRLVVNCAGRVDLPYSFRTHEPNGRHDIYLMYITCGSMQALVNGRICEISAGDVVLFPPEREYWYEKKSVSDIRYHWAHFSGFEAESLVESLGLDGYGIFRVGIDESISMTFMQLVEDFIVNDRYSELSAANRLTTILIAIRRLLDRPEVDRSESLDRVFNSIKHIHENFKKPLTNELLAGIEHLSVSQYIELFKKSTGTTPRSYIIELRMRNACDLLARSNLTVAQIAETVGYDDPHYFSRVFKHYRNISPEGYRAVREEQ